MTKFTFLGTGTSQGVPIIACDCDVCISTNEKDKRLRSSILIEDQGSTFVIDSGPDFRQQLLRAKTKNLDAVMILLPVFYPKVEVYNFFTWVQFQEVFDLHEPIACELFYMNPTHVE